MKPLFLLVVLLLSSITARSPSAQSPPKNECRSARRLYKSAPTDQYGRFELHGIAPGDYKLFSWEEAESGAWEDPEFLKPFEEKGEKISLQQGDQKTLNLTAIRSKTAESPGP